MSMYLWGRRITPCWRGLFLPTAWIVGLLHITFTSDLSARWISSIIYHTHFTCFCFSVENINRKMKWLQNRRQNSVWFMTSAAQMFILPFAEWHLTGAFGADPFLTQSRQDEILQKGRVIRLLSDWREGSLQFIWLWGICSERPLRPHTARYSLESVNQMFQRNSTLMAACVGH